MPQDSGASQSRNARLDTSDNASRRGSATRPRKAVFPFWVIPGTRPHGQSRAPSRKGVSAAASPQRGRTGIDLRASGPDVRRDPPPARQVRAAGRPAVWRHLEQSPGGAPARTVSASWPRRKAAHRRVHVNYGLALLVMAQIAVLAVVIWGLTSSTWQVRHVQVTGTQDPTLIAAIQQLPLTGCNIFRCDTAHQTQLVEGLPAVASAHIHAAYPDGLIVDVSARQPALLWNTRGHDMVIATDGTVLGAPTNDPAYAEASLVQVFDDGSAAFGGSIPQPGATISPATVEMAGQLRKGIGAALAGDNWILRYTADAGFVAVAPNGEQIVFGTPDDAASAEAASRSPAAVAITPDAATVATGVETQLAEVRSLSSLLAKQGRQPTRIDVRWGSHPYYQTH